MAVWILEHSHRLIVCINSTHRAADDAVLVRVPTDVPHTGIMARQSGDHSARQHVINYKDTQGVQHV